MKSTRTDHTVHIENPMCSTKIENQRFRLATRWPVFSQKPGSSGSQWSIHRPQRAGIASPVTSVVLIAPPPGDGCSWWYTQRRYGPVVFAMLLDVAEPRTPVHTGMRAWREVATDQAGNRSAPQAAAR